MIGHIHLAVDPVNIQILYLILNHRFSRGIFFGVTVGDAAEGKPPADNTFYYAA